MVAGLYAPGRFCQKNFSIISVMTGIIQIKHRIMAFVVV
jgi:hypothetical protein